MTVAESTPAAPGARTPVHLWIVGILALLWNLMGVVDYLATQLQWEPYMSEFTEEQLAYFYGFPSWVVAFWAIAVWGSLLGTIALLLRKRWAVWCYGAALVGLVFTTIYSYLLSEGGALMGTGADIFTVVIWIVAIFLLWYSWKMVQKGVLT